MDEDSRPLEIGGWLVLVGIGTVIAPFRILYMTATIYLPILSDGTWQALTMKGSELYNPLWGPLLSGEIVFNVAMTIASFYLIFLFFSKRRTFLKWFIAISLTSLIFIPLDAWVVSLLFVDEPIFDPDTAVEFGQTAVAAAIWIPYILISKRVKATFVNPIEPTKNQFQFGDDAA